MLQTNTSGRTTVANQATSPNGNLAILGVNRIAETLHAKLKEANPFDREIVGFITIESNGAETPLADADHILGNIDELSSIVKSKDISKVVLAIDPNDKHKLHEVIQACEAIQLSYEALPPSYDINYDDTTSNEADIPVEGDGQKDLWFQRIVDLVVSLGMFLLFLPSYVFVALAIKLESKGNVLYSQERVGKNGKIFKIYKFRSMYIDAEARGPQLATKRDPRITSIGRILRKTRIDELPQLVNVIRGDMSLIGPRPERPYFVEKYSKEIPDYKKRLAVKPGLTGWAQVTVGYDESLDDVKEKVRKDLYYIQNRSSVKLYFQIVIKTIWVVVTASGQ